MCVEHGEAISMLPADFSKYYPNAARVLSRDKTKSSGNEGALKTAFRAYVCGDHVKARQMFAN